MKIAIWSDLHLNFYTYPTHILNQLLNLSFDVFICAGDINSSLNKFNPFKWLSENKINTIYVPGNHDYYHSSLSIMNSYYSKINLPYITVLNNSSTIINGLKISGTPLWFKGKETTELNDFRYIKNFSNDIVKENKKCLKFISNNLDSDIFITHHIPHRNLITPEYRNSSLNDYFCCYDCEKYVEQTKAKLWIYGHTHTFTDQKINNCRFYCNPLAYPSENQNSLKIIEI